MGLEPTNGGTTILCLNHLATLAILYTSILSYQLFPNTCQHWNRSQLHQVQTTEPRGA